MTARVLTASFAIGMLLVAIALLASVNTLAMSAQQPQHQDGFVSSIWKPETAYARSFITPEIASILQLLDDGRRVEVVGHITCGEGQHYTVDVTVTQESTGAIGTGQTQGTCTGEHKQQWTAVATAHGEANFEVGRALVCAEATWPAVGTVDWCDRVRLKE